ncbi:guanine nucleotide exchange factor [Pisolithus marmoratus]|nr:guanine nucleotide exchange factor [Pisolithus marmoratus]
MAGTPLVESLKENNALRCIANTCLLIEPARATFIGSDVNGGNAALDLLQKSSSLETIYLTSRILFLCTASSLSAASFIQWMVENKRTNSFCPETAIDVLATKMEYLLHTLIAGKSVSGTTAEDAMTDLLKLIFNLCVHYPKLLDVEIQSPEVATSGHDHKTLSDYWSPRLDGLIPPLLRAFHRLPPQSPHPLVPPMLHIIHVLIVIPVNASNRTLWFGSQPPTPPARVTPTDSATSSLSGSPCLDTNLPAKEKEPKFRAIDRAISALAAGRRSFSWSSTSRSATPVVLPDTAIRACELLDATLAAFFQGDHDPDEARVRNRFQGHWFMNESSMSDIISPLVLLITRFCLGDDDAKLRIRNWFVPENLDRTKPLEGRDDVLGRCLRVLQCVYHERLGKCIGEMFFAMYDSNPNNLTTLGYGNFAGFLFNKGITTGPPPSESAPQMTTSDGRQIDPITGTVVKEREPDDMTEEEKEREAEKLFVLFDRLERSGALPPSQNPVRKAMQKGSGS